MIGAIPGSGVSENDRSLGLSLSSHSQFAVNITFISYFSAEFNFNFETSFYWVVEAQSLWDYTSVEFKIHGTCKVPSLWDRDLGVEGESGIGWHLSVLASSGAPSFLSDLQLSVSTEYFWVFIFPDIKSLTGFLHKLIVYYFQSQTKQTLIKFVSSPLNL